MSQVALNCRNFKCEQNKKGDCLSARIELVPIGGIISHLICIQAEESEESTSREGEGPYRAGLQKDPTKTNQQTDQKGGPSC